MSSRKDFSQVPSQPLYKDPVLKGIVFGAAFLLFWSLDGRYLWQDEAETALLGKNILKFGIPVAYDGKNLISQEQGKEFGPDFVWRWSPWIQFYLAAGSFWVLGASTFTARLPFVLLGLLVVPATYFLARQLFKSITVARLSSFYLATSVPFLLHARQARWFSPAYLLLVMMLFCLTALKEKKKWSAPGLIASMVLLFYTNYFIAIGAIGALWASSLLFQRDWELLKRLIVCSAVALALILPGIEFFRVLDKPGQFDLYRAKTQLGLYTGALFTYIIPLPLLLLAGVRRYLSKQELPLHGEWIGHTLALWAFSGTYLCYVALAPWMMFRYLSVLLPIGALLLAEATAWLWRRNKLLGLATVLALTLTNLIHLCPLGLLQMQGTVPVDTFASVGPVRFPLLGFLYELTHNFEAPEPILCLFLNEHAAPDDLVAASYGDLPLQFYTQLHIVGGLQGQPLPERPDWIILRGFMVNRQQQASFFGLMRGIKREWYERVPIRIQDYVLETNPDPNFHLSKAPIQGRDLLFLHNESAKSKIEPERTVPAPASLADK